ncbi:MAG: DUF58 domain-containing protein [Turicibacter sp.]|nr:DUF58 domain-containing protein [Turicibacter sp.]
MILFLIVLIVVVAAYQNWARKNALSGVAFQSKCTQNLVEAGEEFQLVSTLSNHSRRIIPFLRVEETFPKGTVLTYGKGQQRTDLAGTVKHHYSTYLMPKSQLTRKITLSIPKRGLYYFRGAQISGGDFLGLWEERGNFTAFEEVAVYPKAIPIPHLEDAFGGFLGEVSVRRFMMEDPVLTVGIRDYTGREPLNQISWKHSARRGELQVKQFDYTVEPMVSILLDVSTNSSDNNLLEKCYSLTRSICQQLEQKGIAYDLITNTVPDSQLSKNGEYLAQGLGKSHFKKVLELLGKASYYSGDTFEETVQRLVKKQARSRSAIIVTPQRDESKSHVVRQELVGGSLIILYGEDCHDIPIEPETDL